MIQTRNLAATDVHHISLDGCVFLCVPARGHTLAVAEQKHLPLCADDVHSLAHHFSSNFRLRLLSVPKPAAKWDRKIAYVAATHNRKGQQDAYHTVSVQVIGTIMRSMVTNS